MTTTIIHTPAYDGWVFDPEHPTQGRRFINGFNAVVMNLEESRCRYRVAEPRQATLAELARVHSPEYIARVAEGYSDEWSGQRLDLANLAATFVGGTLEALDAAMTQDWLAVHLPGAKHHAMRDYSSGFCVFADFAIAADIATEQGARVAILDVDAHHGDGTEALTAMNPDVLTFSVHEAGIFPGTGMQDYPERQAFNDPLPQYTGGDGLYNAVERFIEVATPHKPDLIFVAGGADGHWNDPLSSLQYHLEDYEWSMVALREAFRGRPFLFGGAGGYQPDGGTPLSWAAMIRGLAR